MAFNISGDVGSYQSERNLIAIRMGYQLTNIVYAEQVHSGKIFYVSKGGGVGRCDGLVTDNRHLILTIQVADCVPIFMYDNKCEAIGLIHAGWRGTVKKVAFNSVMAMKNLFHSQPGDLQIFMGPSIQACCYEVGKEVVKYFPDESVRKNERGKFSLNLVLAIKRQFEACGVNPSKIKYSNDCTCCSNHNFHSYRRDGEKSGRMICFFHF